MARENQGDQISFTALAYTKPDRSYIPRLTRRLAETVALADQYAQMRGDGEESVDEEREE